MEASVYPREFVLGRDEEAAMRLRRPGPRVLVVDDNPYVRAVLADQLTALGYTVDCAADGIQGLERLERGDFALVITDLAMPGMSGWEVAEAVRRRRSAPGLILITGAATGVERERAEAAGLLLLPKPFSMDELRLAVRRALGGGGASAPRIA
jgi:CheY-like chemotaxis protein